MADSIQSLKRIDNNGVMKIWETFARSKKRFTDVGLEIRSVHRAIVDAWGGEAFNEYEDQFDTTFSKVDDIGDALTEIADAIKEVIYQSFYVADDTLNQQLLEAQHNTREGKGSASSGSNNEEYTRLNPRARLYSTIAEAYVPNLAYPQLPTRPVLVSTIAAAFKPDLGYHLMSPKPVLHSCLPSAVMIDLTYRSLQQRQCLCSLIGDILQTGVSYLELICRPQMVSTTPAPYIPDLSYAPLGIRGMSAHCAMQCLHFLLDYTEAPGNLREVKNSLMATQINQIVIDGMVNGRSDEEISSKLGEAVISNIHGKLNPEYREELVSVIGENLFQKMYGRIPGEESNGKHINWIDTNPEKTQIGVVRDIVQTFSLPDPKPFNSLIHDVRPAIGETKCLLNLQTGTGALQTADSIIAPRESIGMVSPQQVSVVMSGMAEQVNRQTLETCVCSYAAEKTGAVSVILPSATSQSADATSIVIRTGQVIITAETVNAVAAGKEDATAQANISQVITQWSSNAGQFDYSALQYPTIADSTVSVVRQ